MLCGLGPRIRVLFGRVNRSKKRKSVRPQIQERMRNPFGMLLMRSTGPVTVVRCLTSTTEHRQELDEESTVCLTCRTAFAVEPDSVSWE